MKTRNIRADSARAVAAAEARGKVRTNPPIPHTPMSSTSPEIGVGEVLFSYNEERKAKKEEPEGPPRRFTPEHVDEQRLLPRLRGSVRR